MTAYFYDVSAKPGAIAPVGFASHDGAALFGPYSLSNLAEYGVPSYAEYEACARQGNSAVGYYGDYFGTVFLPPGPQPFNKEGAAFTAWTDSRGGCSSPGDHDHHVEVTRW